MLMLMIIYSESDKEYVAALYLNLKDDMFHVANKILQNKDDAEDAVQTAFANIIANLDKIKNLQNINGKSGRNNTSYCIVIVKNVSKRMYTTRKSKDEASLEDVDYNLHTADNLEESALQNYLIKSIDEIIKDIPEMLSNPFVLRYYEDMKYSDIGKLLNITANAAQKRVERATDIILDKLGKEGLQ